MTGPVSFGRRRKSPFRTLGGCLVVVVGLALFSGAIELFWKRLDQRRFPWGYPDSGQPALVGTWVGTLTTGGGVRRGVYMDLRLEPLRAPRRRGRGGYLLRQQRRSNFEGEVRLCGGVREQRFAITQGRYEDDKASRFNLGLSPADSTQPDGLAPSHIRGRWDGRDSLALEADVHMRRGQSAISGGDDPNTGKPATLGMGRGDEAKFRALCGARPAAK
jgi:hypothetical protein